MGDSCRRLLLSSQLLTLPSRFIHQLLSLPRPALLCLQEQYAGIAKAISQFEPLKMIASPGAVSCRRAWNLSPLSNV